jgi:hypothetical protein
MSMRNVFLLPEKFESLSRDELVDAFFGYYYETVIALHDDKLVSDIIDYVKTSLKYTETTNDMLWKHMWLSYCSFVMQRMKYYYFC